MGLEHHWKRMRKSWDFSLRGRRVTFGFWVNVVVDKVSEQSSFESGVSDKEMRYQYRLLENAEHIRILELAPGKFSDPLKGRLIHSPNISTIEEINALRWSMKYEALSYAWGPYPLHEVQRIILDGIYYLPIKPNLDVALRHLRSSSVPRTLWIDAICINQEDGVEKNTQVQHMMEIYAGAEIVNIWLGPAEGDTSMGMATLRYLAERTLDEPAPWTRKPEMNFLSGLGRLLEQPWFSRIWVVQEAAVSRKAIMMCGQDSFQWTNDPVEVRKFIRRIKYAAISPHWEEAGLSKVNLGKFVQVLNLQMQHIERQRNQVFTLPPDILDIAFELRHRATTDRRDKLFAIMGLVAHSNRSKFQPDYSMNVEKVFQQLLESIEI